MRRLFLLCLLLISGLAQAATQMETMKGKKSDVAGTLTFLGKTQPVTLTATNFNCYQNPMLKREVCGGDFETTIQRTQFGNNYGVPGIPDNIKLLIQVEAVKQ